MKNYKLVLPENLNHFGFLFGGYLLKWVDEMAWIAASLDFPDYRFVTIGMDQVEFKRSIKNGTILEFEMTRVRTGRTSVTYLINVSKAHAEGQTEVERAESIFSTKVTMVRVDAAGDKLPL